MVSFLWSELERQFSGKSCRRQMWVKGKLDLPPRAAYLAITAPISRLFHGLVALDEFPLRLATSGFHGGLLIAYEKCQVTGR